MKKNLFIGALVVLSMTACSQDEMVQANQSGNEISFTAVANKGSRAAALYCNNNKPAEISVAAYHNGRVYFSNEKFQGNTDKTEYTSTTSHFWPAATDAKIDFFATAGGAADFTSDETVATITNYTVQDALGSQEDVLYAVAKDCVKGTNGIINLNFRHALSQIVFKAKNTKANMHVVVKGVSVNNVKNTGTFTFSESTATNWQDHNDVDVTTENNNSKGSWGDTPAGTKNYSFSFTEPKEVKGTVNISEVAADADKANQGVVNANAMLLMPQTTGKYVEGTNDAGAYFEVDCAIFNIAIPDDGDPSTTNDGFQYGVDAPILAGCSSDASTHKYTTVKVKVPVDIKWEPGCKYIYTFTFGDYGTGGGSDVLTPIKFTVQVDDFDLVSNQDAEVDIR